MLHITNTYALLPSQRQYRPLPTSSMVRAIVHTIELPTFPAATQNYSPIPYHSTVHRLGQQYHPSSQHPLSLLYATIQSRKQAFISADSPCV